MNNDENTNQNKKIKEMMIDQYILNINSNNINIKKIKHELKQLLGEEPAIELEYTKLKKYDDDLKESYEEKVKSISIIFTSESSFDDEIRLVKKTYLLF